MEMYEKNQMLGYIIISLKNLKYSKEEIKEAIYKIQDNIDTFTEEMAEEVYEKWRG